MYYPKIPKNLANSVPDHFKLSFEYIPQLLKYYTIKGKSLEQIKKQFDFQEAIFIIKQGYNKDLIDSWINSWWSNLVYIWIYQNDMMSKLIELVKLKTDDEWWSYDEKTGSPIRKDLRAHMTDLFGKEIAYQIIDSIQNIGTNSNKIVGLEYVEIGFAKNYDSIYSNLGETERTRVLNYLIMLDNIFKNYQECLEESYLEESLELRKADKIV